MIEFEEELFTEVTLNSLASQNEIGDLIEPEAGELYHFTDICVLINNSLESKELRRSLHPVFDAGKCERSNSLLNLFNNDEGNVYDLRLFDIELVKKERVRLQPILGGLTFETNPVTGL